MCYEESKVGKWVVVKNVQRPGGRVGSLGHSKYKGPGVRPSKGAGAGALGGGRATHEGSVRAREACERTPAPMRIWESGRGGHNDLGKS